MMENTTLNPQTQPLIPQTNIINGNITINNSEGINTDNNVNNNNEHLNITPTIINNTTPKKIISACLACNKNHKKCDGGRPCSYCVHRKLECVENNKRKSVGRPKKTEQDKKKKTTNNSNINISSGFEMVCEGCNTKNGSDAKFCNSCGQRLEVKNNHGELIKEIDVLKKKNEALTRLLDMKFGTNQMWIMLKMIFPLDGIIVYPIPSFILEASLNFQKLLGFTNMQNMYYPDLIPKQHHQVLNMIITVERVQGMLNPKLCYEDDIYMRHAKGHYIHLGISSSIYFDTFTKLPSFRITFVEKIIELYVEPSILPPQQRQPKAIRFYCNPNDEIPEIIKKYLYQPPKTIYPNVYLQYQHQHQPIPPIPQTQSYPLIYQDVKHNSPVNLIVHPQVHHQQDHQQNYPNKEIGN